MKKIFMRIIFGTLLLGLFFSSITISAINNVGPLYTCPANPDPIVDGTIDKIVEWKAGVPLTVVLFDLTNQANKIVIEIMSVYGNNYILYWAVTIPDTAINPKDYFFIVIRTHEVNPIVVDPTPNGKFGAEHDIKFIWLYNNDTMDAFTSGVAFTWKDDISNLGTNDCVGKARNNRTHTTIEMSTPFNSGDANGYDFNTYVNGTIDIFLWYHDEDNHVDYTQIRESDVDWDYIEQKIQCTKTSPISIYAIFLSLLSTAVFVILVRKRKR
ncbi:MAG: hypothetical protein DRP02_12460 [Candidatus Gerdarchaeota archaeon]|nr:MAG: hypothetical protein DRP02_12460 [Candidatus Gerdarchaeota archaeon]